MFLSAVIVIVGFSSVLTTDLNSCPTKIEPIGCYKDDIFKRTLPEEILNERDQFSKVYNGRLIDWRNFEQYLPGFVCRCAEAAFAKGYRMIGIQFYGECWSGPGGELPYDKYGLADTCINGRLKKTSRNVTTTCDAVAGTDSTNFVYRIAPTACNIYYEPVGCFADSTVKPRPVPNYIQNERDYSLPNWNGILIDWKNWNTHSPQMICRCAATALQKKHDLFAIQSWGECWSGIKSEVHHNRDGEVTTCRAENFDTCPCNSYHCVGMAKTNHVYKFINGPVV